MSFNEIVDTLNRQGHEFSFKRVPTEVFATLFPGAAEIAATFAWFEAHTYLGSDSRDRIALANKVAGRQPTKFSDLGPSESPGPRERLISLCINHLNQPRRKVLMSTSGNAPRPAA